MTPLPLRSFLSLWLLFPLLAAPSLGVTQDRDLFGAAEDAYKRGDMTSYGQLKKRLTDYPLLPYLEYTEIRSRISTTRTASVRNYLETYPDTPTAQRLRRAWLNRLAKAGRWSQYLEFYDASDTSVERRCHQLQALIATGRSKEAYAAMPEIWLHGESRPDACNRPLAAWRKSGGLTTELVWDRIELAFAAGSLKLANYLERYLPAADRSTFDIWDKVHKNPGTWLPTLPERRAHERTGAILAHGVKRLAGSDPHRAAAIWKSQQGRYALSESDTCAVNERLGIALEDEPDSEAYGFFLQLKPCKEAPRLLESRVRAALLHRDWPRVSAWIEDLDAKQQKDERWLYWKARALEADGDKKSARKLYKEAAKERTYYGFLAADRVGEPYRNDDIPLDVAAGTLQRVNDMPAMQRMRELYFMDRIVDARREWVLLMPRLDRQELQAAAQTFDQWGWLDRAIFTAAKADYWDDLQLRFPLEYRDMVERLSRERNLDPSWVFGVLRQESAFIVDARSSAGALGLMQVLPSTARQIARETGMARPSKAAMLLPDTSIKLGTAYLRMMLDELYQEQVLATAAYNAGPHRVDRWLKGQTLPIDLWVELIPFKETRTYVQRVLAYAIIYDGRREQPVRRLDERMRSSRPGA